MLVNSCLSSPVGHPVVENLRSFQVQVLEQKLLTISEIFRRDAYWKSSTLGGVPVIKPLVCIFQEGTIA